MKHYSLVAAIALIAMLVSTACLAATGSTSTPAPATPGTSAPSSDTERTLPTMPAEAVDPNLQVEIYKPGQVWPGTTLLTDNHDSHNPRIIEVNMRGEIVWEYVVPQELRQYTNPGFDAELLANDNVLFVLPRKGVYEINRDGRVIWSYLTSKISHDADRLPGGNTIFVFGALDRKEDAQVAEVNQRGDIVWTWYARDWFDKAPYSDISNDGWTHTNAVTRLPNGNTLISPRNFNLVVEVDPQGAVVRNIGEGIFVSQHDPEVLSNGNILVANQGRPPAGYHRAVEIDPNTGEVVWQSPPFDKSALPVRDADRLPNGNTLITGSTRIAEVTLDGDIVWQLTRKDVAFDVSSEQGRRTASGLGFYKAERIHAVR